MKVVFQPSHEAVLMFTSERERAGSSMPRPRKVVLTLRSCDEAPLPADSLGHVGVVSQKGNKMQPNQDCAFYFHFTDSDGSKIWCACVMDGHGPLGHEMSTLAMQWLPLLVLREPLMASEPGKIVPKDPQTVFNAISAAFQKMGTLMQKASLIGWGPRGYSGATCTLALCARGLLHTANIGDSRMILGTYSTGDEAIEHRILTRDHKPEDPDERLRIEAQGGIVARQRVYLDEWPYVGLNMSRSLGDSKLHAVGVSDVPDVTSIFLGDAGDAGEAGEAGEASPQFLVVASDGVWDYTSAKDAATVVGRHLQMGKGAKVAAETLVLLAQESWEAESPDLDDITAIVVQIGISEGR